MDSSNIALMPASTSDQSTFTNELLSELIQAIYRSSMESNFLTSFLQRICETCQLRSASAVIFSTLDTSIHNVWEWGNDQQETETELTADIYREDPLVQKLMNSELNQFYASNLDTPNWRQTVDPRMLDWSRTTGISEGAGAMMPLDNQLALTIYFQRGIEHSDFSRAEIEFWNQLIVHLAEATKIHQQLSQRKIIALETPAILDSFPLPTFLINSNLEVSMFNHHAKNWLHESNLVSLNANKIFLDDHTESNLLRLKTSQLINASYARIEENEEQIFQWHIGGEKITFVLKALEKTSVKGDIYRGALCFVHQASKCLPPPIEALEKIFSLSRREAEICQLLSSGMDTKGIAEHFHLSIHTVRDMLKKRIFIKCGCNSQNALIALLLTSPAIFI